MKKLDVGFSFMLAILFIFFAILLCITGRVIWMSPALLALPPSTIPAIQSDQDIEHLRQVALMIARNSNGAIANMNKVFAAADKLTAFIAAMAGIMFLLISGRWKVINMENEGRPIPRWLRVLFG